MRYLVSTGTVVSVPSEDLARRPMTLMFCPCGTANSTIPRLLADAGYLAGSGSKKDKCPRGGKLIGMDGSGVPVLSRRVTAMFACAPERFASATPVVRPLVLSNTNTKLFGVRVSSGTEASWPNVFQRKISNPPMLPVAVNCAEPTIAVGESC